ncbi:hypothetical protein ACVXHB_28365 [Escherichia coli]
MTKFLHAGSEDWKCSSMSLANYHNPYRHANPCCLLRTPDVMGVRFHGGRVFGVTLDKSESRTDWLARPLTERQCEYAAADVWYLLPITAKLMVETRLGWRPAALE